MTKTIVVTGSDHGLGFALAGQLAERGFRVLAGFLNTEERQLPALCEKQPLVERHRLNLNDDASVEAFADWVRERTDHLDALFNSAGILGDISAEITDPLNGSEIRQVIAVNAVGTLLLTNALYPLIAAGERKLVVNISSEAGSIADCYRTAWFGYCMSKAANNMQGALVHNSLRKIGGQVIQMHPGHVATWMRGHLDTTAPLTPEASAAGILRTMLDRPWPVIDRPHYIDYQGEELNW